MHKRIQRDFDFNINDLATKWSSKSELYHMLTREGQIYLCPIQDATQEFLRQILLGEKQYFKWQQIKVVKVPHYKCLRICDILKFASTKINIADYMPEYEYSKEPNREWVCNVVNTLLSDDFKEFIDQIVNERKQSLIDSQNFRITAKPEFIQLFKESKSVSLKKGRSHFLSRVPKKTKLQLELEQLSKEEEK